MSDSDVLIPVGKLTGTHGIKGMLKLHSYSGNMESLAEARAVTIRFQDGKLQELGLKQIAGNGSRILVSLQGFNEINQVQYLVGSELCLLRSQLPETGSDEYYWSDLLGLKVLTVDGLELGIIKDIFETGSSDIYVVRSNDREYLIPAIADVISSVDLQKRVMLITPLEGLLDL